MNINKFEKSLRNIQTEQRILNGEKRVHILKGETILNDPHIKKQFNANQIKEYMEMLISNRVFFKAILYPDEKSCNISLQKSFKPEDSYIWIREGSQAMKLFVSVLCILGCLCIAMYQVWPSNIRHYTVYVGYLMMAFLGFMLVLGVLRLIVFVVTLFSHPPGIWLFPNLFADCGFVESFIPLWSYHGIDTKPKKKKD